MKLLSSHQRLIREWYRAAWQGREIVFYVPMTEGGVLVLKRMEEIRQANPQLFRHRA